MRYATWMSTAALLSLAACGGASSISGGGSGGGGGGGGPVGHVTVGNIFFRSAHNGSANPAVDTIAVGGTVTWIWNAAGQHTVQSTGLAPNIFLNSVVKSRAQDMYVVTFQ